MVSALEGAVRAPIEARARDELTPWIPLTFEDVTFEPEDDTGALREYWARLSIRFGDVIEETMGEGGVGENLVTGVVILDMFGEPGAGRGPLLAKADRARDLFNRKTISGIEFRPTSGPGEPRPDREGWLMVSLRTPFEAHEVH